MNIFRIIILCNFLILQSCVQQSLQLSENQTSVPLTEQTERVITVQGQAVIHDGAILLARNHAFKDALRNASLQANHALAINNLIASTKVVDEWVSENIYHIQALSVLSDGQYCHSPYRKRIVVTGFPLAVSGQINGYESQDLYSGIPREIMNILMETGDFIGRNKTHTVLYSRPDMAPEIISENEYQDSPVIQLAQAHNSQFVLSGVIRSFEVESTENIRGAGVLSQVKSLMREFVARRDIALDIYVHDGTNGALLFQNRYTDSVIGDVYIPAGYSVGSPRFKSTPSGHKISNIIQLASKDIRRLIGCYPFSANIIKVENKKVFFTAGAQDKIKKGDSLVVYSQNSNEGLQQSDLIGVIIIEDVQTEFSVGVMEIISDSRKIKPGDQVKSW